MSDAVAGLNEGATDIMRTDDAKFEGDFGGFGIANGGWRAAIGHRNDIIDIDAIFMREFRAYRLADRINAYAFND